MNRSTVRALTAFFYIVCGFALVVIFGGKLIVQLLGIMIGFYMIWQGVAMLSTPMAFNATFRDFTQNKFK